MLNAVKNIQCRGWLLTIPADKITLESLEKLMSKYNWIGQLELSKSGYLHYQLYMETKGRNGVRFTTLKKYFPSFVHIEERRGTRYQAVAYVTKKATKQGQVLGNMPLEEIKDNQGKRSDLEKYAALLDSGVSVEEVILLYPAAVRFMRHLHAYRSILVKKKLSEKGIKREIKVFYIYGETRVGKTYNALEAFPGCCRVTHYGAGKYEGYDGQSSLIFDEFSGQIPISEVLTLTDGYYTRMPARYIDKVAEYNVVIFLSNVPPGELYKDAPEAQREAFLARFNGGIFQQVSRTDFIDESGRTITGVYLTNTD